MKSTPIIYSAAMVRARLAGLKTNTRRLVKPQPDDSIDSLHGGKFRERAPYITTNPDTEAPMGYGFQDEARIWNCPYGRPGDELWTRENYHIADYFQKPGRPDLLCVDGHYLADQVPFRAVLTDKESEKFGKWKRKEGNFPAIYLFRSLCRDVATITSVRAQRLQDINGADSIAEGIESVRLNAGVTLFKDYITGNTDRAARASYRTLWDSINAKPKGKKPGAPWESNPWVWALKTTAHGA